MTGFRPQALEWLGNIDPDCFERYQSIGLEARHFYMPADTDAFCRLVEKSVRKEDSVVDLGCGDGIPTIHALACGARHVLGVDVSPVAIQSTLDNWNAWRQRYGETDARLRVLQGNMIDFLETAQHSPQGHAIDLIASNPPYVPVGEESAVGTVDGGPDGLRFIGPLLRYAGQLCDRICWLQGSFSSPAKAIRIAAENNWMCEQVDAYAVKFRHNAQKQAPYLELLQQRGEAFFYTERDQSTRWFIKLGLICTRSVDRSEPVSNLMITLEQSLVDFLSAFSRLGPQTVDSQGFQFPIPVEYGVYPQ